MTKIWTGTVNSRDDFGRPIRDEFIDGRTKMGPWAIMAPTSHALFGIGLGTGKGQRYEKRADQWEKVEG